MSTPSGFAGPPPPPEGFDPTLIDPTGGGIAFLISLLRLLVIAPDEPARPVKAYEHPQQAFFFTFQATYWAMKDAGWPGPLAYLLAAIAATIVLIGGTLGAVVLLILQTVIPEIASAGLDYLDAARKTLDPEVAGIAVQVLNELMGTDLTEEHLPGGDDVEAHIARAAAIGNLYINTIQQEISPGTDLETVDGLAGVARFTGLIVNFGVATALVGLFGELGSFGLFKNFRLIGEQVSSGLGLSKQMRIAIKPLLKTLVATPFQWQLNKQYHPQRFSVAEVVNPFAQTFMDHDLIVRDLELQGWNSDRAEALIRLHAKRLTVADIELNARYSTAVAADAESQLEALGYLPEVAKVLLPTEDLRRADAVVRKLLDELDLRVNAGDLSVDDFSTMLDNLPIGPVEKRFWLATVNVKTKTPHAHLTFAQAQKAFEEGIWTLDQLDAYLTARGYSADDAGTLQTLTLLALAKVAEAQKVAQFNYDKKVAAAKAKHLPIPPPPAILGS